MFLFKNPRGQTPLIVTGENRHNPLGDDDSVIELFVNEVDRASGDIHAILERLPRRVPAWKGWQQGGMDVQNTLRICLDKLRGEQAHVSGEADQVNLML